MIAWALAMPAASAAAAMKAVFLPIESIRSTLAWGSATARTSPGNPAPEPRSAILEAWHGRLGGPLADLNALVGEDVAIESMPIDHNLKGGEGTITVGDKIRATMAPYRSAYGAITTLRDSIFSTIPGAPAYIAKASEHVVNIPEHGMVWTFKDRNAIQGDFLLEA